MMDRATVRSASTPAARPARVPGAGTPVRPIPKRLGRPPADWRPSIEAAPELGLSERRMCRLIAANGIATKTFLFDGEPTTHVPRAIEREALWPAFIARNSKPRSLQHLARVREVASILEVSIHFEWPDEFFDSLLRVLKTAGLPFVVKEAQALVRGDQKLISLLFRNALERRGLSPSLFDRRQRPTATVAEFRAALSDIDRLEGTVLAEPDEVVERLLSDRERGAIVALPQGRVRNAIGLYAIVKCFGPSKVCPTHRLNVTHDGGVLAKVLAGTDTMDSAATDRTVRGYVFGPARLACDSRRTRRRIGARWVTFANLWRSHEEDFPETRRRLRAAMPVFPERIALFAVELKSLGNELDRGARRTRKKTTEPLADTRDETEALLEARSAQVERWTDAFLAAKAIVEADPTRDRHRYTFVDDVVPEDGPPDGSTQVAYCTAIRLDALRRELWETADDDDRGRLRNFPKGDKYRQAGDRDIVVCVYETVRAAAGSPGSAVVPAFVRLHASGCLANPAGMKPAKLVERAALYKEWDLPAWAAPPLGLIAPSGRELLVAAHALRQERVVLHLEEFRHSSRFARPAGRLSLRNGMRSGEAFQLRWQVSGFGFARVDGEVRIGMRAFPKDWKRQRLFLLDDTTFLAIADLVQLTIQRFFPGSPAFHLPKIVMQGLQPPVGPLGHAVFQGRSGRVKNNFVNRSYRLLMAGTPKSLMHHRRHVFANAAAMDGVELDDISDLLSQEGYTLAGYYAAATQRQIAANLVRLNNGADDRGALL